MEFEGVVHVVDRVLVPLFGSIVEMASSFKDYSILLELLETAGLVEVLLNEGPFTVFAPNNAAFYGLFEELDIALDDVLKLPNLAAILALHLLNGATLSGQFESGDVVTVNGQSVGIEVDGDGQLDVDGFAVTGLAVMDAQGRSSNVIIGNIETERGDVVHVVDRVLLPLFDTVVDVAASLEDFSSLVAAVNAANLVDTLRGPGPFTVFAPNNEAFTDLLSELSISIEELLDFDILSGILLYHVIGRSVTTDHLESGPIDSLYAQSIEVDTDRHPFHDGLSPFTVKGIVTEYVVWC